MLQVLVLLLATQSVLCHVVMTFPPARRYAFDYLDSFTFRSQQPCGMAKTPGAPATTLLAGTTVRMTWHLSYPHRGGVKLILIFSNGTSVNLLPGQGFHFGDDTITESAVVTIPDLECTDCTIRLVREGAEYGSFYQFWSCADVTIVKCQSNSALEILLSSLRRSTAFTDQQKRTIFQAVVNRNSFSNCKSCFEKKCQNGGTCDNYLGSCQCNRLFTGDRCQYKDECWTDEDCSYHGQCIDTRSTSYPKLKCYCQAGWFGSACEKASELTEIARDYSSNPRYTRRNLRNNVATMYWRYVKNNAEIEIVMKVRTRSWIGVGWKGRNTDSRCKRMDPVLEVEAKLKATQTKLMMKQRNYNTTRPNPRRDPEIDIEGRLVSLWERNCQRNRKRRSTRVRRQQAYRRVGNGMDCSDITVTSVKGNLTRIQDMWTRECSQPMPDAEFGGTDDITAAVGKQEGEYTTITFRKRVNSDHFTDHSPDDQEQFVIWAKGQDIERTRYPGAGISYCGASDPRFFRHDELKYHGGDHEQTGTITMTFPKLPIISSPPSVATEAPTTGPISCVSSGELKMPEGCISSGQGFNCQFSFGWRLVDETIQIVMKAAVDQTQYIAVGFSTSPNMPMSDIYSGHIMASGRVVVTDRWAHSRSSPRIDREQNVSSVSGRFDNGVMIIEFSRPQTSSHSTDLGFSATTCHHVLFAKGRARSNQIFYHGNDRGMLGLNKLCIPSCSN